MKKIWVLVSMALLGALSAQAGEFPILSRSASSGFVAPSMRRTVNCQIFESRIEISQTVGGARSDRVITQSLDGNVQGLIEAAKAGPFTPTRGIPDTGMISYSATLPTGETLTLKTTGRAGSANDSSAAATLEAFIDLVCGT